MEWLGLVGGQSARQFGVQARPPLIVSIAAVSPSDVWAFTLYGQALHLQGSAWSESNLPGRLGSSGPLVTSAALKAGRGTVWAFGGERGQSGKTLVPYAARRSGTQAWMRVRVPGHGLIAGASAVSGNDIWAVLGNGLFGSVLGNRSGGGLLHWHGHTAALPAVLRNGSLGAVLARSDHNVWVGGAVRNSRGGTSEAVGHWNGHGWTVWVMRAAAAKRKFWINSIVPDGSGGLWAIGLCESGTCSTGPGLSRLWHYSAGRWSQAIRPAVGGKVATLIGLADFGGRFVLAAGGIPIDHDASSEGLIARWGVSP